MAETEIDPAWVRPANPFDRVWLVAELKTWETVVGPDAHILLDELRRGALADVPDRVVWGLRGLGLTQPESWVEAYWESVHNAPRPTPPRPTPQPAQPLPNRLRQLPPGAAEQPGNPCLGLELTPLETPMPAAGPIYAEWRAVARAEGPVVGTLLQNYLTTIGRDGPSFAVTYAEWWNRHVGPETTHKEVG